MKNKIAISGRSRHDLVDHARLRCTSCQTGCSRRNRLQQRIHNPNHYPQSSRLYQQKPLRQQQHQCLSKAQIGYSRVTYLTYDPSVWQVEFKVGAGSAMSGQDVYDLIHIQFGCILHDNLGHGVPETWTSTQYLQQLGTIEYQVEKWVDTTTGEAVLVVYHYPPGNWENYSRIELVIDGNPDACISAAETVLGLSEADIIGN